MDGHKSPSPATNSGHILHKGRDATWIGRAPQFVGLVGAVLAQDFLPWDSIILCVLQSCQEAFPIHPCWDGQSANGRIIAGLRLS